VQYSYLPLYRLFLGWVVGIFRGICCGEGMCSPETARCLEEHYPPTSCQAGVRPRGSDTGLCNGKGCSVDQSWKAEVEGDKSNQSINSEGSHSGNVILRLLHLAGRTPPHRVHQ
uniref:Uncharacterized protein n=1 Tax=Hucho hucho TaxID=62062 RepID=A0A4W5K992_9TELE